MRALSYHLTKKISRSLLPVTLKVTQTAQAGESHPQAHLAPQGSGWIDTIMMSKYKVEKRERKKQTG